MYEVTSPKNSGRVIAVWSPVSRQGGVSTLAAMLTAYLSHDINNDEKVLLMSNDSSGITAAWYLSKERAQSGLADVVDLSSSENLRGPEDIYNNAFTLTNHIDVLISGKSNIAVTTGLAYEIEKIFKIARKGYKYVIVDTSAGFAGSSQQILEHADVVIVSLPQDKYYFDGWTKRLSDIYPQELDKKPRITVLQQFYNYSSMTYQYMAKKMAGEKLYYIDLNTLVYDAVSNRNMLDTIQDEAGKKKHDDVIDQLEAISREVMEKIEGVVEKEATAEQEMVNQAKQSTKEYMESDDFFLGLDYDEDQASEDDADPMGYGYDNSSDTSGTSDDSNDTSDDTGVNLEKEADESPSETPDNEDGEYDGSEAFGLSDDLYKD